MAIKKTALYSSLWASCDELRGGMDASQYKDYILTLLFVKYVSDKYAGKPNAILVVPKGGSFKDMLSFKGKPDVGDQINKIIGKLAEENDLKGVIDVADFNDEEKLGKGKEMQDRLSKLLGIFESLNLSANRAEGDDLLGDAYEYLMRHFATQSGKSKGQFYTPAEVSRILAKVIGINSKTAQDKSIYDPTCGSGSLLLKGADEAPNGLTIYGQEMDNATHALARMNMILHNNVAAEIHKGNTLADPHWKEDDGQLKLFDFAVANPPFSFKAWSNGFKPDEDLFNRFEYGLPPDKNGDYAFLLHIIKSLKSKGKGAVILPHGVLFRGNAEAGIRRNIIRQGYIKGIIGLPANLFYGTGIPACIIVLDKEGASKREGIFMIDASKGFIKDGNKNRLRSQDIHKIVDVFTKGIEIDRFSRFVPTSEIEGNDYNLNIPRYIDSSDPEDIQDLDAHLNGGIPKRDIDQLEKYWEHLPSIRKALFKTNGRKGYVEAKHKASEIKSIVMEHQDYSDFSIGAIELFYKWKKTHLKTLLNLEKGVEPKGLIFDLSEDLLSRFKDAPLLDKYDIYQHLMNYWAETMQDDVFLLSQDGWKQGNILRQIIEEKKVKGEKKSKKPTEEPDLTIAKKKYKADLIPPSLIVEMFFEKEQEAINSLQAKADEASQEMESFVEENGGEGSPLEEAKNDKDKITKKILDAEIKSLKKSGDKDDLNLLLKCSNLLTAQSSADKAVKAAQKELDEKVFAKYPKLKEEEIKDLVVHNKWLYSLENAVHGEIERVISQMVERIKTLEERYDEPLPKIEASLVELNGMVEHHLKEMGLAWK